MLKIPHILILLAALPLAAQEERQPTPTVIAEPATSPASAPESTLPKGEERIREGIMLLADLHDTLARVQDKDSAEAAVAPVMRLIDRLQKWGQSFNSLPPLDAETNALYEERYIPIIEQLNARLKIQGERIASAEFYGSRNLPAALVRLVTNFR